MKERSLYIHIPFCRKKCRYCDFYSIEYQKEISFDYIDILCGQISKLKGSFSSIYIGGGTPSILDLTLWKTLLMSLSDLVKKSQEFTVEVNPESLNRDKILLFRDRGVNRLSLGIQSFDNIKLKKLGRVHSQEEAVTKLILAKDNGFENISIDLIFGVWGQNFDIWEKELETAVNLPIKHISIYCLSYESGTPIFKQLKEKKIIPLDENLIIKMHNYNNKYLSKKGFMQYEVSNYAKKGYESMHNMNYWKNNEYLGLGPGAVSFIDGIRQRNVGDVRDYLSRVIKGEKVVVFREKLSPLKRAKESAALKIRTKEGIIFHWFKVQTGFDFMDIESKLIDELIQNGLIRYKIHRNTKIGIYLTSKGFLFSDTVSSSFL